MRSPLPVDYDAVAKERAKEDRECPFYELCLIRAAYHSPGLWVPCAACGGLPVDLPGLEALVQTFQAHHLEGESYGAQVAYGIMPGAGGRCESVFSYNVLT